MTLDEFTARLADVTPDQLEAVLSAPNKINTIASSVAESQKPISQLEPSEESEKDTFDEYLSGCSEFTKK